LDKALRVAVLASAGALAAMFVYVVASRFFYPYELEWMCGSMLDHVERVRSGLPVYTAPSLAWIPYLYPPLLDWIGAALGGSFVACRSVSVAATIVQGVCAWRLARHFGATRYWATVGVLLFCAAFFYVGYWYDVERSDTLCVGMVLAAVTLLVERATIARAVAAGALLGVAVFAKQQALPFLVGGAAGLAIARQWTRAGLFAAAGGVVVLVVTKIEDAATGGWFSWYVFTMPAKHGIDLRLWRDVLDYDVPHGIVLVVLTIALCVAIARRWRTAPPDEIVFGALLATGGVAALSSRLHIGGWINVLQTWTSIACPAVAIGATRAEAWLEGKRFAERGRAVLYTLVIVQLALWIHSPTERVPDAAMRAATGRFLDSIHALEQRGEVLLVGRGHVTKARHFQMSGLADVVRVGPPPQDLVDAIAGRRLAAIVDDARGPHDAPLGLWSPTMLEDVPALRTALFANYYVAERNDEAELFIPMPAPALPRWVYLPRKTPLAAPEAEIARRHFAELVLADARSSALRAGKPAPYSEERIEELAARDGEATTP
jgi:hypothetical protein